jgi:putative hemolysin
MLDVAHRSEPVMTGTCSAPERVERRQRPNGYEVQLAFSRADIREAQQLRYRIFAGEMGAVLHSHEPGLDVDHFDEFCYHLTVRHNGELVAYTRILTSDRVASAGSYYSQSEFDISRLLQRPGRYMEIGRTCVHPEHRNGAAIMTLWNGLAQFMERHHMDYLMGCASIPMDNEGRDVHAIMERIRDRHFSDDKFRVTPRLAVPAVVLEPGYQAKMPPLLKAYLRVGATICGEPCWDPDFGVADVFVLLDRADLDDRYARHFVERPRRAA